MNEFDDIDRALFALPLETPPPDLRERILAATVRSAAAVNAPVFRPLDVALIGAVAALLVWAAVAAIASPAAAFAGFGFVVRSWQSLGNPALWLWLAAGGSVATWVLLLDTNLLPVRVRARG